MKVILLSHPITSSTPIYPGTPPVELSQLRNIERGDSSNLWRIAMANHTGTHVDAPNHFYSQGRKISEYTLEELVFRQVKVFEIFKEPGGEVSAGDLEPFKETMRESEMILIRTGLERFRRLDPAAYAEKGVLFSPSAAHLLREAAPRLRGLGIDAISVSTPLRRAEGRETHRILLSDNRFLIVEDMALEGKPTVFSYVIVAPLLVAEVDSAPCTVIGITE